MILLNKLYFYVTMCAEKELLGKKMKNSRRDFLKKVAYSTPVVASLGMLVEPTGAEAYNFSSKKKNQKTSKLNAMKSRVKEETPEFKRK